MPSTTMTWTTTVDRCRCTCAANKCFLVSGLALTTTKCVKSLELSTCVVRLRAGRGATSVCPMTDDPHTLSMPTCHSAINTNFAKTSSIEQSSPAFADKSCMDLNSAVGTENTKPCCPILDFKKPTTNCSAGTFCAIAATRARRVAASKATRLARSTFGSRYKAAVPNK